MPDLDLQIQAVDRAMQEPNWPQWVSSLLRETDDLLGAANHPSLRFASRAEAMARLGLDENDLSVLGRIATRLQLVAASVDSRKEVGLRVVGKKG